MLAKTYSATVLGIEAHLINVELNATGEGEFNAVSIVGLPDTAVKESKDRVRSALQASEFMHPTGTTLVNLAPADVKKEGAAFDLPIALCMLGATHTIPVEKLAKIAVVGELALDGTIRPVRGVLPIAVAVNDNPEIKALLVPMENANEAAIASEKIPVFGIDNLKTAVEFINNPRLLSPAEGVISEEVNEFDKFLDFADVKGQSIAKRGLEIAAAGAHNILMMGPPGTGKSMTAQRLPTILPKMTFQETLQTSKIHSILGLLSTGKPLLNNRPFRSPHHTISDAGLIGGGKNPTPGEISLAHNGVLFLDELPEFKRNVLEVLRQPLENGTVNVARAAGSYTFPANFILVAAMNPCPCGMATPELGCRCTPMEIKRYRGKISGPLLDRIDLHVELLHLSNDELLTRQSGEPSSAIKERVLKARKIQEERFAEDNFFTNAQMQSSHIREHCELSKQSQVLLKNAINNFRLSPRAYDRILKVARTIADLGASKNIEEQHLFESINYRNLDRRGY